MSIGFYLIVFLCVLVFIFGLYFHNGDWLNPLTANVFLITGTFTIASYLAVLSFTELNEVSAEHINYVFFISSLYLVFILAGYSLRRNLVRIFIYHWFDVFASNKETHKSTIFYITALLLFSVLSYMALMYSSGVGLLWIQDTRSAYQLHRSGVGHWWLIYQWLLMAAFLKILFLTRVKRLPYKWLILYSLFFMIGMYFSGSKSSVLSVFIVSFLYAHYFIKKISITFASLVAIIIIMIFLLLLVTSGAYESIIMAPAYFIDYFYNAAEMLYRFEEIGFRYGEGWLTSLWFYVPRGFYSEKPYEYGLTLIHKILFPGMAEQGATPGIISWALSYLDFGVIGVALEGFIVGSFQRAIYVKFLERKNIGLFIIMVSSCYVGMFSYATPVIYIAIAVILNGFIKLRISSQLSLTQGVK